MGVPGAWPVGRRTDPPPPPPPGLEEGCCVLGARLVSPPLPSPLGGGGPGPSGRRRRRWRWRRGPSGRCAPYFSWRALATSSWPGPDPTISPFVKGRTILIEGDGRGHRQDENKSKVRGPGGVEVAWGETPPSTAGGGRLKGTAVRVPPPWPQGDAATPSPDPTGLPRRPAHMHARFPALFQNIATWGQQPDFISNPITSMWRVIPDPPPSRPGVFGTGPASATAVALPFLYVLPRPSRWCVMRRRPRFSWHRRPVGASRFAVAKLSPNFLTRRQWLANDTSHCRLQWLE